MKKISILLADDHTLFRESWAILLNLDLRFTVIGETGSGLEVVKLASCLQPDVILMDINMPDLNGILATELIRRSAPASKILGVSMHTQPAYAKQIMKKGAKGYITKSSSRKEIFNAIVEVHEGRKYICKEIKNILAESILDSEAGSIPALSSLSDRELEVIDCIKKGFSSKQIGEKLGITSKTAEVHRHNILKKLEIKNTASLVDFINKNMDVEIGISA